MVQGFSLFFMRFSLYFSRINPDLFMQQLTMEIPTIVFSITRFNKWEQPVYEQCLFQ